MLTRAALPPRLAAPVTLRSRASRGRPVVVVAGEWQKSGENASTSCCLIGVCCRHTGRLRIEMPPIRARHWPSCALPLSRQELTKRRNTLTF